MNLKTRLSRIEAITATTIPCAADQAYRDWLHALLDMVYSDNDQARKDAKIAALGPRPAATTASQQAFEAALLKVYGEPDTLKPGDNQWAL